MNDEIDIAILEKYEIIEVLGKGGYGIVWRVIHKKTKKVYALKKICQAFENIRDARRTYREVMFLEAFEEHENIISLQAVVPDKHEKDLYLLFEYIDSDLQNLIRAKIIQENHIQFIAYQILKAIKYIHSGEVVHRDLKPSNILVNSKCHVKIADFGLARSIFSTPEDEAPILTEYIATRWYRAPEILLGSETYGKASDMWAFGCIMAEMVLERVFFQGTSTLHQIEKILEFTGEPSKEDIQALNSMIAPNVISTLRMIKPKIITSVFPNVDEEAIDLIKSILKFNPMERLSALEAMNHRYFKDMKDRDQDEDLVFSKPIVLALSEEKIHMIKDYIKEIKKVKTNFRLKDGFSEEPLFKPSFDSRTVTIISGVGDDTQNNDNKTIIRNSSFHKQMLNQANSPQSSLLKDKLGAQFMTKGDNKTSIFGKTVKQVKQISLLFSTL